MGLIGASVLKGRDQVNESRTLWSCHYKTPRSVKSGAADTLLAEDGRTFCLQTVGHLNLLSCTSWL